MRIHKLQQKVALATLVFFLSGGCFQTAARTDATSGLTAPPMIVPYYEPPEHANLCGEPVPLHRPDVRERLDREFAIVVYGHAQVYLWLKRMERYFPWIERQLAAQNLPDDLKWVAVAESDLLYTAHSPAGAAGPWQFISSTGLRYGLTQSTHIDERHDFEMATQSAFNYLKDLYGMFDNWTLAIAAYNCGEGRVKREMGNQKATDYYSLKLPLETERYILRIVAIKEVLSHPERYGYMFPEGAGYPELALDQVKINFANAVSIQSVAEAVGTTYRKFKILNPAFKSDRIPAGSYALKVPEGKGTGLQERAAALKPLYEPPKEPRQKVIQHKVKRGETLIGVAKRYNVTLKDIKTWNKMTKNSIQIGQVLKIIK